VKLKRETEQFFISTRVVAGLFTFFTRASKATGEERREKRACLNDSHSKGKEKIETKEEEQERGD